MTTLESHKYDATWTFHCQAGGRMQAGLIFTDFFFARSVLAKISLALAVKTKGCGVYFQKTICRSLFRLTPSPPVLRPATRRQNWLHSRSWRRGL